jgi:Integrase core domain
VYVLEISPTSATGMRKVVVIGDVFSQFMMAIAVPADTATAIAEVLFERWIAVFGPPVRLLSDQGKVFVSEVVQNLCARVGTKKTFTSPYASQTEDLAKFVTHEKDWDRHLTFAVFRYNASRNEATGVSPFSALFGVDPFDQVACFGLELRLEDEPHDVAQRLAEVHGQFYKKAMRSRAAAQVQYDKAVQMCSYAVGNRVLIYFTSGETESGRKLRVPWIGPYRITKRHSAVGYSAVSKTASVHVNRLKAIPESREVDTSAP